MQSEATSETATAGEEGRYRLLGVIARGGQGNVWRARDTVLDRDVALKLLNEAASRNADAVERLRRERSALEALAGTCAVRLLDGPFEHEGAPCVAMELLDGVDLETRLSELEAKSTRLAFDEVTQVLEPLVQTLHKAHGLGIVHRDLKPANVFLLQDGGVRLIDFGFVRLEFAERMTAFGVVMGSPCYIAPEVWQGHANTSGASVDIYSLAVMAYRMLAGHPPFETQSLVEMRELAITARRPSLHELRPDLPAGVDAWVKRALAVDPKQRFATVREMWEALCEAAQEPKPSNWSFIPRAVAASLQPKRVAEALRRAGAVLWGRPFAREADAVFEESSVEHKAPPTGARKRERPSGPPLRAKRMEDEAVPISEVEPISVAPVSTGPRSSRRAPVTLMHVNTTANLVERNKRRRKPKRRRANKQKRKARQMRRRARARSAR